MARCQEINPDGLLPRALSRAPFPQGSLGLKHQPNVEGTAVSGHRGLNTAKPLWWGFRWLPLVPLAAFLGWPLWHQDTGPAPNSMCTAPKQL